MFDEKQSNSLLLNKTAITIRPGSLQSIFSSFKKKLPLNLTTVWSDSSF